MGSREEFSAAGDGWHNRLYGSSRQVLKGMIDHSAFLLWCLGKLEGGAECASISAIRLQTFSKRLQTIIHD